MSGIDGSPDENGRSLIIANFVANAPSGHRRDFITSGRRKRRNMHRDRRPAHSKLKSRASLHEKIIAMSFIAMSFIDIFAWIA
jgi:hypothetical protein